MGRFGVFQVYFALKVELAKIGVNYQGNFGQSGNIVFGKWILSKGIISSYVHYDAKDMQT